MVFMNARIAVYAGTFDPVTLGHLDVIERAMRLFDKVIIAITTNPKKKPLFSLRERIALVRECTKGIQGISVEGFAGLLVDFLRKKKAKVILRGLRELSDFETEFQQAIINRKLAPSIETVFVVTNSKYFYLNSTAVKEIASMGGSIECMVAKPVEKAFKKKFGK